MGASCEGISPFFLRGDYTAAGGRPSKQIKTERLIRVITKVMGRKDFHVSIINWSYRKRGKEARTQRNPTAMIVVLMPRLMVTKVAWWGSGSAPKKRMAVRKLINRMLAYSARKKSAKGPAEYSTLKPETSSDSPSVRSKGVRLVSARIETNQIINKGKQGKTSQQPSWASLKVSRSKDPVKRVRFSIIRPMLTS